MKFCASVVAHVPLAAVLCATTAREYRAAQQLAALHLSRSIHTLQMSSLAARARSAQHSATATSAPTFPPCSVGAAPSPASLAARNPPFAVPPLLCPLPLPACMATRFSSGTSVDTPLPSMPPPSTASPRAFWKALQCSNRCPVMSPAGGMRAFVTAGISVVCCLMKRTSPTVLQHQHAGSGWQNLLSVCCK